MLMLNLTAYTCNIQNASILFSKQGFFLWCLNEKPVGFILQKVEESYAILCQRLAGSALTDKYSGMWTLWVSDSRIVLPEQYIEWNDLLFFKVKTLWDSVSSLVLKKRSLFPNIMRQAEATICWLGSSSQRGAAVVSPHATHVLSFFPFAKAKGRAAWAR